MVMGAALFFSFFLCLSFLFLFFSSNMQILKVSSLNVNGVRNREKRALLTEFLKLKESHVTFLQETHSDESNEADWGLCWEGSYSFSHGTT